MRKNSAKVRKKKICAKIAQILRKRFSHFVETLIEICSAQKWFKEGGGRLPGKFPPPRNFGCVYGFQGKGKIVLLTFCIFREFIFRKHIASF